MRMNNIVLQRWAWGAGLKCLERTKAMQGYLSLRGPRLEECVQGLEPQALEFSMFSISIPVCVHSIQSCPTLCAPMDCSPPGSFLHEIIQARILEWVVMPSFRGSSWPRDQTQASCDSCIAGRSFTTGPLGSLIQPLIVWWSVSNSPFLSFNFLFYKPSTIIIINLMSLI